MEEIDLREFLKLFWNKKGTIILIIILFISLGLAYTIQVVKPVYTSSTTLVLATSNSTATTQLTETGISTTDITINSKLVSTYSELVKSNNVIRKVLSNLKINMSENDLRNKISVNSLKNTELIEIKVTDRDALFATTVANEIAKVFIEKVEEIYKIENVHIVDIAEVPESPSNINHTRDIILFAAIGFVVSVAYILMVNLFDTTIKSAEEIENVYKLNVLSSMPIYSDDISKDKKDKKDKENKRRLVVYDDPKSPIAEIFRTLRTNIQFMKTSKDAIKTILITSTFAGEGKSWISSNLAVSFAQAGKKVLLIDADMRKGRQYSIFGIASRPGLSNYLSGVDEMGNEDDSEHFIDYVQKTNVDNLYVMAAGNVPPNPSELLISDKMVNLLEEVQDTFDQIIIDSTPSQLVTDSLILAQMVDSTVVVTACKETKKEDLRRVIENIKNIGGKISGVILNKIEVSTKQYKEKYYYRYKSNEAENFTEVTDKTNFIKKDDEKLTKLKKDENENEKEKALTKTKKELNKKEQEKSKKPTKQSTKKVHVPQKVVINNNKASIENDKQIEE